MDISTFYDNSIAFEETMGPDINTVSPGSAIANKVLTQLKVFVNWLLGLVLKFIGSLKAIWRMFSNQIAKIRGGKFAVDEFGYMNYILEARPIIDDYFMTVDHLNKIDHQINKGLSFEDKAMNYVGDGVKGSLKIQSKKNTKRDNLEAFTNFMIQADRQKSKLTALLEEAHRDIPTEHPKSYSVDVLQKEVKREFDTRLEGMQRLKYNLEVVKKTYQENNNFIKRHFGKLSQHIKRNNQLLNHCASLINLTEQFKALQVKLINQINEVDIDLNDQNVSITKEAYADYCDAMDAAMEKGFFMNLKENRKANKAYKMKDRHDKELEYIEKMDLQSLSEYGYCIIGNEKPSRHITKEEREEIISKMNLTSGNYIALTAKKFLEIIPRNADGVTYWWVNSENKLVSKYISGKQLRDAYKKIISTYE